MKHVLENMFSEDDAKLGKAKQTEDFLLHMMYMCVYMMYA